MPRERLFHYPRYRTPPYVVSASAKGSKTLKISVNDSENRHQYLASMGSARPFWVVRPSGCSRCIGNW